MLKMELVVFPDFQQPADEPSSAEDASLAEALTNVRQMVLLTEGA